MFNLPSVLTFSANGDRLVGTYYSSIRKQIECKSLITDDSLDKIGGDDADCNLLSDGTFEIVLGAFATVTTGDVISFYQDPSKGDSSPTVDVPVASGSFIPAQPTAILFVDKNVVSSCDRVVLDASASATLDGRKLQYSWSASTAPSSDMLYFLNERFSQWKYSIMTFDASLLETGTYTVEVTVQSSFNTFSKQSISFDVIGNAVPTISLKEGLSPTVNIGSLELINAHIRFPLCHNGNPRLTRWNYTMDETKSSAANVDIKFRDGILVFGPSYTVLPIEGDYYFSVTAQADRAQPADITAVDPSKDLVLLSRFIDRVSRPTYLWESDDLSLDDIECTLSYLKLPKTLLTGTFTIRLTVTDGTTRTGSTSLTFTLNQPPSKGVFEISPNSGVALKTLFNIGCSNGFSDPHLPLTYQFFYYDQWIGDWKQLNDRSERKSITSPLPVGSGSGNTLRIKAVVYDSKLASTSVETSVVVTAPSAEEARSILLNTTTQGTISQSTATAALDLLKTIQTNDSNIIRQTKDVGSQYINAYFENVEEQVAISGETSDSASAKIDIINTASGSSAYLHDSTSSTLISKLLNTTSLISSSGTINTESSTLDIAKQAADSLFTRVNQAGMTTRKANAFSKTDIDNLKQIYHSLLISYTKNLAPDMPATRLAAQGILGYNRKLNAATLNGLAEIVDGKHKYIICKKE
ncbi:hypothetical protein C9374_010134 [Naegleria lovaniensis]|uniref:PKD/REJ-like domain-containing protein n=1 Tax=Naegleria lovaniensis TaxID=51637 RepID=A0AA88GGN5_NAELO|nr:uncharacterized protein C9374_010134 [Naegleria lovaniensis]KAG2375130.1 hypothetical protein C9374_010134 [Naegleria lovaniensis]